MPTMNQISELREKLEPTDTEQVVQAVQPEQPPEQPPEEEQTTVQTEVKQNTDDQQQEELVTYFNDLPDVMGWSPDDFYNLKLKADDGEEYTWSQIKDSMQVSKQRTAEIAAKEAELTKKEQEVFQQLNKVQEQQPITEAVQAAHANKAAIEAAYDSLYKALPAMQEADDTAGLVRAQSEMLRLQGLHTQAVQGIQQAEQAQQQTQYQTFMQYRQKQEQLLAQKVPEYATNKEEVSNTLKDYLLGEGLQPQEVGTLVDARAIALFYKAMKYDEHLKNVAKVSQDVRDNKVTRIVRGQRSSNKPATERNDKIIEQGKSSHAEQDKRAAFRAVARNAGFNLGES